MVAKVVQKHVVVGDERVSAKGVSDLLARLGSRGGQVKLVVELQGQAPRSVAVNKSLAEAFRQLSALIQTGDKVSMFVDDPELSPEEASDLLGISRPMVVQRIKCGDLNARMVGAHHRIKMSDLLAFRERAAEREAALSEFSRLTDDMALKHGS
jgi:excisionase family DNA binding protein